MIGQVHWRCLVRGRFELDGQFIIVVQHVSRFDGQLSRVAFFAIRTRISENHTDGIIGLNDLTVPDHFVKTFETTVKVIFPIILGQRVRLSFELKLTIRDSIAITTHRRAEIGSARLPACDVRTTQRHIGQFSIAIGAIKTGHDRAIGDQVHPEAVGVGAGKLSYRLPVSRFSVIGF